MFRRFDRLVPIFNEVKIKIPIKERWEIRDFKIKDVSKIIEKNKVGGYTSINGYTYGIPYNEQWDIKDFILKK
jgi:hypothetical protein